MNPASTWLRRLAGVWRRGTGSEADADPGAAAADARLAPFADKLCSAEQAVAGVRAGDQVFVGTACAAPRTLLAALEARQPAPADVQLLHFLSDQALAHGEDGAPQTAYRQRCFFVGQDMREAVARGLADYVPISLARVPALMAIGRIPVDVALIQVSPPDAFGYVSLGISVDIVAAAVARARLVVAEVNPAMPRTQGETMLHVDRIHCLVPVATPLIEYPHPSQSPQVVERIARYISSLIEDGATLQVGLGRFSHEAFKHLADRRDLGIHSDVITDAILPLLEQGVINGRLKTQHKGRIVTSFAMGSRRLYDLVDGNPLFSFQPIDVVCDAATLAAQHKLVSITQAFAIDLSGQVCVDQFNGRFCGGLAAQAEFMQGAARSPGGKAIICLAATDEDGKTSRIRAQLAPGEGVGVPRADVHHVVTEFGVAYLFGKSLRERALALVQIAHPDCRPALFEQARALGLIPADHRLRHLGDHAVERERAVQLKDGRELLLRPASADDGEALRQLFNQLPEADVYTRFFRRVRGLSTADRQHLCNLNDDTEVALVAVSGTRESPLIVGHALYVLDPSTNLAETAFMVHPQWQGLGLGARLQQQLAEQARAQGVLGFVAEILASNERMIRLARQGSPQATLAQDGSTLRVTTLF